MTRFIKMLKQVYVTALLLISANVFAGHKVIHLHNDLQGSPVMATDENGAVLWREEYKPYGEKFIKSPAAKNDVGYTGHQSEDDIGLVYQQQRWQDPLIGRFYSDDPLGFNANNIQSFNRYAYGNNNPYKYVDDDGRLPVSVLRWSVMPSAATAATAGTMATTNGDPSMQSGNNSAAMAVQNYFTGGWEGFVNVVGMVQNAVSDDSSNQDGGNGNDSGADQDDKENSSRSGSGKNERHGDGGRAKEKGSKQIDKLKDQAKNATGRDKKKIEQKIKNIQKDADKKAKGEEHSRAAKR